MAKGTKKIDKVGNGKYNVDIANRKEMNKMTKVIEKENNSEKKLEDMNEMMHLLVQLTDNDRLIIKGMMMWAAGENKIVETS